MLFCDVMCFSISRFQMNSGCRTPVGIPTTATPPPHECAVTLFLELRNAFRLTKKPATAELLDWAQGTDHGLCPRPRPALPHQATAQTQGSAVDWRCLPDTGCLLKLREDVERVTQGT